jgi:hypothetical protein
MVYRSLKILEQIMRMAMITFKDGFSEMDTSVSVWHEKRFVFLNLFSCALLFLDCLSIDMNLVLFKLTSTDVETRP